MSTTSLLQTALQNLHVSQQVHQQSHTPKPPSSSGGSPRLDSTNSGLASPYISDYDGEAFDSDDDGDIMVNVGKGTRPGTPTGKGIGQVLGLNGVGAGVGSKERGRGGSSLAGKSKDPLRTLPTHLAVRVFLQLDIKSLARADRVSKRWHKSSTLNYVWFLQNRALLLPRIAPPDVPGGKTRQIDAHTEEFFDPYDKSPRLSSLPTPPLPTSQQPQWTKMESKKAWRTIFRNTFKRSDPNAEPEIDTRRVDVDSLHTSGTSTPAKHGYSGLGSGGAARWAPEPGTGMTNTERKIAAREEYRALGGRKSRTKRKMGGELGGKDKGGAVDDGRFDAPW